MRALRGGHADTIASTGAATKSTTSAATAPRSRRRVIHASEGSTAVASATRPCPVSSFRVELRSTNDVGVFEITLDTELIDEFCLENERSSQRFR